MLKKGMKGSIAEKEKDRLPPGEKIVTKLSSQTVVK
jgi:hypothetical protein